MLQKVEGYKPDGRCTGYHCLVWPHNVCMLMDPSPEEGEGEGRGRVEGERGGEGGGGEGRGGGRGEGRGVGEILTSSC